MQPDNEINDPSPQLQACLILLEQAVADLRALRAAGVTVDRLAALPNDDLSPTIRELLTVLASILEP